MSEEKTILGPIYQLKNLVRRYGASEVVAVEALEIQRGEVLAIVGPNGAGKSTLLRMLNFLEPPSSGELLLNGRPVPSPTPIDVLRRITMVFQRPHLLRGSVWQNVTYGLRLRGLAVGEPERRLMEQFQLDQLADVPCDCLSGGEMQRVALARAMALHPQILLLDEPTANLDPYSASLIEAIIHSIRRRGETTTVLVTHQVHQARRLADRVAMLAGGRLVEVGETEQFFHAPRSPKAAAFIKGELIY